MFPQQCVLTLALGHKRSLAMPRGDVTVHQHEIRDGCVRVGRVLDEEPVADLRVGHGLSQLVCAEAVVVYASVVLNEVHCVLDVSCSETMLLLLEPLVYDAARKVIHPFALNDVV
jgi:hypothetical protein